MAFLACKAWCPAHSGCSGNPAFLVSFPRSQDVATQAPLTRVHSLGQEPGTETWVGGTSAELSLVPVRPPLCHLRRPARVPGAHSGSGWGTCRELCGIPATTPPSWSTETGSERGSDFPKATQLGAGRGPLQAAGGRAGWLPAGSPPRGLCSHAALAFSMTGAATTASLLGNGPSSCVHSSCTTRRRSPGPTAAASTSPGSWSKPSPGGRV